jgi:hypothetical protein
MTNSSSVFYERLRFFQHKTNTDILRMAADKKTAKKKAEFLAECLCQDVKIDTKTAEEAIESSRSQHKKWWKIAPSGSNTTAASKKRVQVANDEEPKQRHRLCAEESLYEETQLFQNNGSVKRRYERGTISATKGIPSPRNSSTEDSDIDDLRRSIIAELTLAKGDTTTPKFASLLLALHTYHLQIDPSEHGSPHNGEWRLISGPSYHECEGANDSGQAMYTLGRMSFDMFRPSDLKCSMGRIMNLIDDLPAESGAEELPFSLRMIRQSNPHICGLKRYDIITELFIEVDDDLYKLHKLRSRRVPAILTTRGYCMIDGRCPDHLSIWFSSGSLTRGELVDVEDWRQIFEQDSSSTNSGKLQSKAETIARRVFLGAESFSDNEGNLHFKLHRPIGGSNKVFVDTIYADDSLRILRGNHGSILVFEREIESHYYASTA